MSLSRQEIQQNPLYMSLLAKIAERDFFIGDLFTILFLHIADDQDVDQQLATILANLTQENLISASIGNDEHLNQANLFNQQYIITEEGKKLLASFNTIDVYKDYEFFSNKNVSNNNEMDIYTASNHNDFSDDVVEDNDFDWLIADIQLLNTLKAIEKKYNTYTALSKYLPKIIPPNYNLPNLLKNLTEKK